MGGSISNNQCPISNFQVNSLRTGRWVMSGPRCLDSARHDGRGGVASRWGARGGFWTARTMSALSRAATCRGPKAASCRRTPNGAATLRRGRPRHGVVPAPNSRPGLQGSRGKWGGRQLKMKNCGQGNGWARLKGGQAKWGASAMRCTDPAGRLDCVRSAYVVHALACGCPFRPEARGELNIQCPIFNIQISNEQPRGGGQRRG